MFERLLLRSLQIMFVICMLVVMTEPSFSGLKIAILWLCMILIVLIVQRDIDKLTEREEIMRGDRDPPEY